MTSPSARMRAWWTRLRSVDVGLPLMIAAFAFVLRIIPELRGELPGGTDYDEGVYFATANALARGIIPYRDFVSVHPPGVPLLLTPIAGPFTSVFGPTAGFLAARIVAAIAGAVTTFLVYRCAQRLSGTRAAVLASVLYATFGAAIVAEGRILLDPFMIAFAVAGSFVFLERHGRRAAIVAGTLLGLAVSMKVTGAVFIVGVLVVGLAVDPTRRRDTLHVVAATTITFALITLPFAIMAGPGTFVAQVVTAQVDRPSGAGLPGNISSVTARFSEIMAWGPLGNRGTLPNLVNICLAVIALSVVVWGATRRSRRAWFWTVTFTVALIGLSGTPTFYVQYAALAGAPLAILLGGSMTSLLSRLSVRAAMTSMILIVVILVGWEVKRAVFTTQIPLTRTQELLYSEGIENGCVFTDEPDAAFVSGIIPQDGLRRPLIDPFGELLSLGGKDAATALDALHSPQSQQRLRVALEACPWVILSAPIDEQFLWTEETRERFVETHALIIGGTPSAWFLRSDAAQ